MSKNEQLNTILNLKGKVKYDEESGSWYLVVQKGSEIEAADFLTGVDFDLGMNTEPGDIIEITVKRIQEKSTKSKEKVSDM
ncbi:hypothetical protein [Bacillus vallismortis]|uniref:hypothetical protein n=1 Tax=Bacillus vallismortis TaxID=72361 RepID=UPI00028945D1|nr:hypothetical protein [Bacillus vallismortis]MBG9768211.1 hypothetical protein [Bacillus vallismortis]QAV08708.1 hypothetical protein BV11031_08955 [Bacillus vallismortis]